MASIEGDLINILKCTVLCRKQNKLQILFVEYCQLIYMFQSQQTLNCSVH